MVWITTERCRLRWYPNIKLGGVFAFWFLQNDNRFLGDLLPAEAGWKDVGVSWKESRRAKADLGIFPWPSLSTFTRYSTVFCGNCLQQNIHLISCKTLILFILPMCVSVSFSLISLLTPEGMTQKINCWLYVKYYIKMISHWKKISPSEHTHRNIHSGHKNKNIINKDKGSCYATF